MSIKPESASLPKTHRHHTHTNPPGHTPPRHIRPMKISALAPWSAPPPPASPAPSTSASTRTAARATAPGSLRATTTSRASAARPTSPGSARPTARTRLRARTGLCGSEKGRTDVSIYPHDTLKFCRDGFCTCMAIRYAYSEAVGDYGTAAWFDLDDDHAWCLGLRDGERGHGCAG